MRSHTTDQLTFVDGRQNFRLRSELLITHPDLIANCGFHDKRETFLIQINSKECIALITQKYICCLIKEGINACMIRNWVS